MELTEYQSLLRQGGGKINCAWDSERSKTSSECNSTCPQHATKPGFPGNWSRRQASHHTPASLLLQPRVTPSHPYHESRHEGITPVHPYRTFPPVVSLHLTTGEAFERSLTPLSPHHQVFTLFTCPVEKGAAYIHSRVLCRAGAQALEPIAAAQVAAF